MREDCADGLWLAWGKYFAGDLVLRFRWAMICIIEELAHLECWPTDQITRATYEMAGGPIGDILPNFHHYVARLEAARAAYRAIRTIQRQCSREWIR